MSIIDYSILKRGIKCCGFKIASLGDDDELGYLKQPIKRFGFKQCQNRSSYAI